MKLDILKSLSAFLSIIFGQAAAGKIIIKRPAHVDQKRMDTRGSAIWMSLKEYKYRNLMTYYRSTHLYEYNTAGYAADLLGGLRGDEWKVCLVSV